MFFLFVSVSVPLNKMTENKDVTRSTGIGLNRLCLFSLFMGGGGGGERASARERERGEV